MGWTFGWNSKDELIKECLRGSTHFAPIAHSVVGNNLWVVVERKPDAPASYDRPDGTAYVYPKRALCLYLMQGSRPGSGRDGDGWGYKDLDESCGPCEVNCPLKYLEMVPDPGGYATDWRKAVQAHHQKKNQKAAFIRTLRIGDRLKLIEGCKPPSVTVCDLKPLTGIDDTGRRYKVQPRHIEAIADRQETA